MNAAKPDTVTVTIDIPRTTHRLLKARAALSGQPMAGYLLTMIRSDVQPAPDVADRQDEVRPADVDSVMDEAIAAFGAGGGR